MSNRDSLGFGELLPQDVVDIFAHEKHSTRGQKKRSRSLGRALGWLKGKKRKDHGAKGQSPGLGPALDLALDVHPAGHQGGHKGGQKSGRQAQPQAVPKRVDDDKTEAPPILQENVFIEASRPKYLENLHTEALEGLKMMQQEETNNGVEFQDNESTISTMSVHTDGEGGGFMTDSTIADTTSVVSVQSSVSTRSSRSGLTRQGSTFRPLNSGKKSEKTRRRRHRKTVGGIPQHVQRELGLDRTGWTQAQRLDEEQFYNGESDLSPGSDWSQPGASGILQETNAVHPLNKEQLDKLAALHKDDLALLHRLGPDMSEGQRPHSLAVPWMTTANSLQQEPPSPVMSMSPQAPYMSKIIPNAVLPPSIEVVEISRGRSRNSVRTVSKSSLLLSSPAPSRASSRASTITSASRNPPNMSDSSCWSNSESSETLVSDSSTISRSSTPKQKRTEDGDVSAKEDKISVSSFSKGPKYTSNGKLLAKVDEDKKEGFSRSLSVMKPKRAPPPPSRSYSLHNNKMKRRSRDLAEVRINSKESSLHNISASGDENEKNKSSPVPSKAIDSPGYHADTSSLEDSPGSLSFSPFRSQAQKADEAAKVEVDALQEKQKPPQDKLSKVISPSSGYSSQDGTPVQPHSSSPRHKRGILAKLQRLFPGSSSAASTAAPVPQPEVVKPDTTVDTVSPSVRALRELFNIPLPPKVHAPPPPPPEVWAHSKRSVELLLGPPAPDNLEAIIRKNPKDRRQQRQSPSASTEGSVKSLVVERKHKNPANGSVHVSETTKVQESGILSAEIQNDRLAEQKVDLKENSNVTEKVEKVRGRDLIAGMLMKAAEKREERLAAGKAEEAKKTNMPTTEEKTRMDTLPAISLARIPPSPSPPPGHHPANPPTKKTTVVVVSPESSWPPPPPPLAPAGLNRPDEVDFPLPPPPMFGEGVVVIPVQVPSIRVTAEAEPQKTSTSQGAVVTPLNIPPPPSYTAPPPPVKVASPSPPMKKFTPLPPLKEVSPPPAPPPPVIVLLPPTTKEVSPPPPPPPPVEVLLFPIPKEVSPPPPKEVSPPPPPPKEFSPLPPPPKEFSSPPPPPKEVSPPLKEVSPPQPPAEVLLLPVLKQVSPPPPPKESPPLVQEAPPPLVQDVSVTLVSVVSSSPVKEPSPPLVIEASTLPTEEVSPPPSQESTPEEVTPVSKLTPPQSIPPPPPLISQPQKSQQEIDLPQEVNQLSYDIILTPPQSIPPAPPVELLHQPQVVPPNTDAPATQEASPSSPSEVSIRPPSPEKAQEPAPSPEKPQEPAPSPEKVQEPAPSPEKAQEPASPPERVQELAPSPEKAQEPASSPEKVQEPAPSPEKPQEPAPSPEKVQEPAPSLEKAQELAPSQEKAQEPAPSQEKAQEPASSPEKVQEPAPSPAAHIPLPPPLPVQGVAITKEQPSPASTETQTLEPTSAPVVKENPTPVVTPSLLQMVKLRSVSSSPEPPKAPEQPEAEVTMRKQEPRDPVPTSSASAEAPQKPIRRSLIILCPTPTSPTSISPPATSPPATVIVQPALPKSQSVLLPPASSSTVVSPTKKSPPAMTASPSMNLQEAIRLRTAARSKENPVSRLSLHSPTSPIDLRKSPSSTASFIFSKSNKKVVIETKPEPEKKVASEAESVKKGVKVPPPVARKPKTKGKEIETSEGMEHTAGQEAQQDSIKDDAAEKTNGTAGTVEVGGTPST
ncbi:proline-rich protein 36-like isoform X2 [Centropristis striata]|uniref:proline-rich protein 36-like isoform X2 n=1 Tax=Centropristis striata TaxID=184440 RepID=UPI0027DEB8EA|nr:proline-rich protein 36-like isoform X2 [Centropristis striata]